MVLLSEILLVAQRVLVVQVEGLYLQGPIMLIEGVLAVGVIVEGVDFVDCLHHFLHHLEQLKPFEQVWLLAQELLKKTCFVL